MPKMGSTMKTVALLDPKDLNADPVYGDYLSPDWTHPIVPSLWLTVGSSTLPVAGGAELLVANNHDPGFYAVAGSVLL
jgi:hypothetical protein